MAKKRATIQKQMGKPLLQGDAASLALFPSAAAKFIPLVLIAAGILAYVNSLSTPFIFDDRYHIVENARIRQLWPIGEILRHSSRPVVSLSLALNYALGGLNPAGYHAFNVGIHILAALALFGIVRRTFLSTPLRAKWGAAAPWLSGFIALVWLVHPLQTESVTYTIQRGESMMGLFYLVTLYCVTRLDGSSKDLAWKSAAVASCLLGMACKGVIATAPLVVLVYDRAFLASSWGEIFRRRKGFYLALSATLLAYPALLAQAPEEWKESAGFEYSGLTPLRYAMTQPGVVLYYLKLAFWPNPLCLDYGWQAVNGVGEMIAPGLVMAALIGAAVWALFRSPGWGFLGAWFFVILFPTSSFMPIADIAFEHRMYLSLASVIAAAVVGMVLLGNRDNGGKPLHIPLYGWIACSVAACLMFALTIRRNSDYSSDLGMWEDTVRVSPNNPRAHYDVAVSMERANQMQSAIAHYQTAIQLNPRYVEALNNLGHALSTSGKSQESLTYLRRALEIKPTLAEAHNNLGYALAQLGKLAEATPEFEEALRLKPGYSEAHNNLGSTLALSGRPQEAMDQWNQALRWNPELIDAHNNIAYTLLQAGKTREAIDHYERALRIKPDSAITQLNLAKLLATAPAAGGGDARRAVNVAERASQLAGGRDPAYLEILGMAYASADRFDDAAKTVTAAAQLSRAAGRLDVAAALDARAQVYRERRR